MSLICKKNMPEKKNSLFMSYKFFNQKALNNKKLNHNYDNIL